MKLLILTLLVVGLVSIVGASCEEGQIDINSASLEKLDELTGIGPAYAGRIVESRPFASVEDLVKVKGIGEITLGKIVEQGLACVDGEIVVEDEVEERVIEDVEEESEVEDEVIKESVISFSDDTIEIETTTKIILLNSEEKKTEEKLIYVSKNAKVVDYLSYGFAVFLIFIIGVLIWDKRS